MERVFTQDIFTSTGDIKFGAGEVRDYSPMTWNQIAGGVGKGIADITCSVVEAAKIGVTRGMPKTSKAKDHPEMTARPSKKRERLKL